MRVLTPGILRLLVWPLPRSLATTSGISVDVFSSPYLDVSVQAVPHVCLFDSAYVDRFFTCRVAPFRNLRIEAYLQLPEAYRSLSRLSSAPSAKAFALRPCSLDRQTISLEIICFLLILSFANEDHCFPSLEIVIFLQKNLL